MYVCMYVHCKLCERCNLDSSSYVKGGRAAKIASTQTIVTSIHRWSWLKATEMSGNFGECGQTQAHSNGRCKFLTNILVVPQVLINFHKTSDRVWILLLLPLQQGILTIKAQVRGLSEVHQQPTTQRSAITNQHLWCHHNSHLLVMLQSQRVNGEVRI